MDIRERMVRLFLHCWALAMWFMPMIRPFGNFFAYNFNRAFIFINNNKWLNIFGSRWLGTTYANTKTKQKGIPVYVYELDIGHEINTKKCFCRDENTCPARGALDLYRCMGLPLYATLPHFYKAEQLLDGIESGLVPNQTFHKLYINLEMVSRHLVLNV